MNLKYLYEPFYFSIWIITFLFIWIFLFFFFFILFYIIPGPDHGSNYQDQGCMKLGVCSKHKIGWKNTKFKKQKSWNFKDSSRSPDPNRACFVSGTPFFFIFRILILKNQKLQKRFSLKIVIQEPTVSLQQLQMSTHMAEVSFFLCIETNIEFGSYMYLRTFIKSFYE